MAFVIHNAPSLENPFAWDMVDDNFTAFYEPYDELQNLTAFLLTNYCITSFGGGIVSFLMLYLVLFKTSGALKKYRKMLFICCITDLTYWVVDNFMWMKVKEKDGVFIVKMEGLAGHLSFAYRAFTMAFYVWSTCFLNAMLPVQFYFRYYSLTRQIFLTASQTLGLCAIALVVTIPTLFFTFISFNRSPDEQPGFNYGQLWYQEFPLPELLFGDVVSGPLKSLIG
uniref:G_PROTEIN_RECEP_F1_2 domain-containing protein n=1 Tax=Bursaphelenchus xylophilus TaxID=6326 RepID=A0A1I7SJ94_BURXY